MALNLVPDGSIPNCMKTFPAVLFEGYRAFKAGAFSETRERYRQLAKEGQTPHTLIIACCDSRASPSMIFDVRPGEIFVVRNVANLVPPFNPDGQLRSTSAAIEYAVKTLKVKHILVLGHGRCGGIQAALGRSRTNEPPTDFIGQWMDLLEPAAEAVAANEVLTETERLRALERISIRFSIQNLRTFPFIAEKEAPGVLTLHGAWFDISTGELWIMDSKSGDFWRPEEDVVVELD